MYGIALAIIIVIDLIVFLPQWRKIKLINILLLAAYICIAFNVRQTPDINNYILRFNLDYAGHDYGFTFLAHFFRDHGATFYEFQNCFFLIALSCIAYGLIRLTKQRALIYILYFFFPFLLNLVQLRNFMVLALLVLATGMCYGNENKITKSIWWCVLCGLAATLHIVAIAYIPFIFIWNNKRALRYIIIGSSVLVILLLIVPGNLVSLVTNIVNFIADEKRADVYSVRATTQLGVILMVAESIAMMLIAKLVGDFVDSYNEVLFTKGSSCYIESSHFKFVINLLYYSSVFWPFYFLNGNFTRLMQNEYFIIFMAMATLMRYALNVNRLTEHKIKMRNNLIVSILIFIPLYIYSITTIWGGLYEDVVVPILGGLF